MELPADVSPEKRLAYFFRRRIGWLQKKLELPDELVREVDELREVRNRLAHSYLTELGFLDEPVVVERDELDDYLDDLRGDEPVPVAASLNATSDAIRDATAELRQLRARLERCHQKLAPLMLRKVPPAPAALFDAIVP
jgi:hypothetical protein